MIVLIDNYDSFTYNLYQFIRMCGKQCEVIRNDVFELDAIKDMNPEGIVISPGPGIPDDAGLCIEVIREYHDEFPILGICLGHQCIGRAFGAEVSHAKKLVHGKNSRIFHDKQYILRNIDNPFHGARYHSLSVKEEGLPPELEVIAKTEDGEIMAIKHVDHPVFGLQFHPESILTGNGIGIIRNFLEETVS